MYLRTTAKIRSRKEQEPAGFFLEKGNPGLVFEVKPFIFLQYIQTDTDFTASNGDGLKQSIKTNFGSTRVMPTTVSREAKEIPTCKI